MLPSHRVISPRVRLDFAGWQSDTYILQNCGWQLSVSQDNYGMSMTIAAKHPKARVIFISSPIRCESYAYEMKTDFQGSIERVITENVKIMMSDYHIAQLQDFKPVDATPTIVEMREMSYHDYNIFKPVPERTDELVVKPEEVGMWIKRIKEAQGEKQREIREKIRKGRIDLQPVPEHTIHAQIISLAA